MMSIFSDDPHGWVLDIGKVEFDRVLQWQHGLVKMRKEGMARDTIILVEHPPVITVGRDGHKENYSGMKEKPIFIERGGDVTYHGPGQLVAYFIFNLTRRGRDLHKFMTDLQDGIINTLQQHNIQARKDDKHTGVWVDDKKIASVGIAVKNWITFHGVAININTNLEEFRKINPCGLKPKVMTSVSHITGKEIDMKRFGRKLIKEYGSIFSTVFETVDLDLLAEDIESQAGGYTI